MAHDRRPGKQASGERACLVGAGAEVVERIQAAVDARDRDPSFAVIYVVWDHEVVGNCVYLPDSPEGVTSKLLGIVHDQPA